MTTPESDPYADSGGSDWEVRPAVPGWSVGQDFLTGPIFDDTGWHIDLSNVDWAGRGTDREQADHPGRVDGYGPPVVSSRRDRHDLQAGNGVASYPAAPRSQDEATTGWPEQPPARTGRRDRRAWPDRPDRPEPPGRPEPEDQPDRRSGRHARHARPDDVAQPRPAPPPGAAGRPREGADTERTRPARPPGRWRDQLGYQSPRYDPSAYQRPGYDDAPGREPGGYERPGYPGRRGDGRPRTRPPYPPGVRPAEGRPRPPGGRPAATRPPGARPGGTAAAPRVPAAAAESTGSFSIVRSSGVMAVATLGSRLTGFLRQIAQSAALGALGIAAAYNLSNTLPNVVYNLALGGILTSVIVPLIVNAAKRDSDRGEGYDQRMFTLVTAALAAITLVAMIAAVPIVHLYAGSKITGSAATLHLAVILSLFFIPQIFFYGVSSLIGAILNSRGSFAAPMWTPIVNNLVVIVILGLYIAVAGLSKTPATISGSEIQLLGVGTTLGIVAQTVALIPALRRVGFRWHPRMDFRRGEISEIGRMAGWMFGYIAATQVAFLVTTRVASDASISGITEFNYAWLLFQLPYAVVGISVITALLPRMSAHAAERRYGLVRQDFSAGVRLAAAIVVPCSLVLAALGPKLAEVFLGYGAMSPAAARYIGLVFAVFCLGLLPYMIFQLQLRVFYALHDSKTPALIGLVTMAVNIAANLIALSVLRPRDVVAGLGVGFGLANVVGMMLAWRILTRRLRGLDGYRIGRSLVRMHAATLPAALIAVLVGIVTGNALVDVVIGGGLAAAMYLLFARALRIEEMTSLSRTVLSRLGR
jgi:putative peptidoglycan lipid II flippase